MATRAIDYEGEISARYAAGRSISPEAAATWRAALVRVLPRQAPIVDVGAGTGRFTRLFEELAPGRVIAVEPARSMRRSIDTPAAAAATAEELPFRDASIGLAWSAFTTHYLDLTATGAEFARVLRGDGVAAIWHVFPDVFDQLEWFRWFPTARRIDEERMPPAEAVIAAFERGGLTFAGRSEHRMLIAPDLGALADRLAHRSISTLHLIPDQEFDAGLERLRAHARATPPAPVYAPNVLLRFGAA